MNQIMNLSMVETSQINESEGIWKNLEIREFAVLFKLKWIFPVFLGIWHHKIPNRRKSFWLAPFGRSQRSIVCKNTRAICISPIESGFYEEQYLKLANSWQHHYEINEFSEFVEAKFWSQWIRRSKKKLELNGFDNFENFLNWWIPRFEKNWN